MRVEDGLVKLGMFAVQLNWDQDQRPTLIGYPVSTQDPHKNVEWVSGVFSIERQDEYNKMRSPAKVFF